MDPKKLEDIHDALAATLLQRVRNGEATAADLNVARQFLKDNGVEVTNPAVLKPLGVALTDVLPFEAPDAPVVRRASNG
jgi:hypothetical protein